MPNPTQTAILNHTLDMLSATVNSLLTGQEQQHSNAVLEAHNEIMHHHNRAEEALRTVDKLMAEVKELQGLVGHAAKTLGNVWTDIADEYDDLMLEAEPVPVAEPVAMVGKGVRREP